MRGSGVRRILDFLLDNPILIKELRIGLRERKIFLLQSLYLVILGSATAMFLFSASAPSDLLELPEQGRLLHGILFWSQLTMVILITPSLTCGQISGERENHSLDLLRASRLRTVEIVLGKLGYALAYVGLLLVSSLPMVAVVFLLGGVAPAEVVAAFGVLALVAALAGLLGLFFSAREHKTSHATNQAYGVLILGFILGISALPGLVEGLSQGQTLGTGILAIPLWLYLLLNALCLAAFLFLKIQNHLRRRVAHESWLGRLFLGSWLANCGVLGLLMTTGNSWSDPELVAATWCAALVVALASLGCFLDPRPFAAPREEALRRSGLTFRPGFWIGVLLAGLALIAGAQATLGASLAQVVSTLGLCAGMLVFFSWVTRGLHALLGGRPRFAALYYSLLSAILVLPTLPLAAEPSAPSFWLGLQISPLPAVWSLWDDMPQVHLAGLELDLPSACMLCWLGLAALVGALRLWRRTRSGPEA